MYLKISDLENQDYYNLVISLEIISAEIVKISQQLVVNETKIKLFSKKKAPFLLSLHEEKETLKIELHRLTEYFNQIISLIK